MDYYFKKWITAFQDVKGRAIGDLARDVTADKDFPDSNDKAILLKYFTDNNASDQAVRTFENAYAYFQLEYGPLV